MRDLGTFADGTYSMACGINSKGQVIGQSDYRAFIWQDGKITELPPLPDMETSVAKAINDSGLAVGESNDELHWEKKRASRACIWDQKRNVTALPILGGNWSEAHAINNKGQIVGNSGGIQDYPPESCGYAVIWQDGKITDLNKLIPPNSGWILNEATGINDAGQIVGDGDYMGHTRAFLLTPIP
jgi:probable HAF family extracellular repeat protein